MLLMLLLRLRGSVKCALVAWTARFAMALLIIFIVLFAAAEAVRLASLGGQFSWILGV